MDEGLWAAAVQRVWRRRRGSPGHGTRPTDPAGRGPGPNVGLGGRGETRSGMRLCKTGERSDAWATSFPLCSLLAQLKTKVSPAAGFGTPSTTQMSQPTISKELAITSAVELEVSQVSASAREATVLGRPGGPFAAPYVK